MSAGHMTLIKGLIDSSFQDPQGKSFQLDTREVLIDHGALSAAGEVALRYARPGLALLVADENTFEAAGDPVAESLDKAGFGMSGVMLEGEDGDPPLADEANLRAVQENINDEVTLVVAIGSGSVNDMAKLASFHAKKPFITVATAPSMNGFTSRIAAIIRGNIKRTEVCHAAKAVIGDLNVLCAAPKNLVRAGFGDLMSKPVSSACWKLAHLIKGEPFSQRPYEITSGAFNDVRARALEIGDRDPHAIRCLFEAIILSGFSMSIAGSSAPASGGEHLISHYWDMTALRDKRRKNLHGEQVGIGTLLTATLYQKLADLDVDQFDAASILADYPDIDQFESDIRKAHGDFADFVWPQAKAKYLPREQKLKEVEGVLRDWKKIWGQLAPMLEKPARLRGDLEGVGAVISIDELGIDRQEAYRALTRSKDIRSRYTVLDLAADLGLLEQLADETLLDSGVLGV
ncbi:MAG: Glycerol-1-phosphate dehydrogenase [NAD(P)+] [Myxococcota bacterium]|nr:Glycerol-1-phosphate dehydrogenase [NAD(P)+] [Myxococcota bacterium]